MGNLLNLLECQKCGQLWPRLINYDDQDICCECFFEKKLEEAKDTFNEESFSWLETDD